MSRCWITLSLLYVLRHRVSADSGVSLICNKTVMVQKEKSVTLNCSISWAQPDECVGTNFSWNHTDGRIPCDVDLKEYTCEWDNLTYVSLTILSVQKEENYTVGISSNCGMDYFPSIMVQVNETLLSRTQPETPSNMKTIVLSVVATAIVVAGLCFLFKWCRTKRKPSNKE